MFCNPVLNSAICQLVFGKTAALSKIADSCSSHLDESAEEGRYNKASVGEPCPTSERYVYSLGVTYLKLSDAGVNTQRIKVEE